MANPRRKPSGTKHMWTHDKKNLTLHVKKSSPGAFSPDPARGDYGIILERAGSQTNDGVEAGADFIPAPNHFDSKSDAYDRATEWMRNHP